MERCQVKVTSGGELDFESLAGIKSRRSFQVRTNLNGGKLGKRPFLSMKKSIDPDIGDKEGIFKKDVNRMLNSQTVLNGG